MAELLLEPCASIPPRSLTRVPPNSMESKEKMWLCLDRETEQLVPFPLQRNGGRWFWGQFIVGRPLSGCSWTGFEPGGTLVQEKPRPEKNAHHGNWTRASWAQWLTFSPFDYTTPVEVVVVVVVVAVVVVVVAVVVVEVVVVVLGSARPQFLRWNTVIFNYQLQSKRGPEEVMFVKCLRICAILVLRKCMEFVPSFKTLVVCHYQEAGVWTWPRKVCTFSGAKLFLYPSQKNLPSIELVPEATSSFNAKYTSVQMPQNIGKVLIFQALHIETLQNKRLF